jgi:hypothetical protein
LAETQPSFSFADSIREARRRLAADLRAQAEQIHKLTVELRELQQLQDRTEKGAGRQWDEMALAAAGQFSPENVLENVLSAVRALMTCTVPEQLFATLTAEASQWGVRAAIFDVRGNAAWGASANGFGPGLLEKVLRTLIVPLNQDNPFRQVWETAGPVDATVDALKKSRNVLDKLKPDPHAPVLLLPIRSAGTVAAILYADPAEHRGSLPVNALMILAEFAGAQIDRLIALSGGFSVVEGERVVEALGVAEAPLEFPLAVAAEEPAVDDLPTEEPPAAEAVVAAPPVEAKSSDLEGVPAAEVVTSLPEPAVPETESIPAFEPAPPIPHVDAATKPSAEAVAEAVPVPSVAPPEAAEEKSFSPLFLLPSPPGDAEIAQASEAEQKTHRDARRFAKLLVSEIELYNKAKVADARKHGDLYRQLKFDIDRSRQTFEKRYSELLGKQCDYFHEELVRSLAENNAALLGPEYPGPSV